MQSWPVQLFLSMTILASFLTIVVETQMQAGPDDDAFAVFVFLDHMFLTIFTLELLANMFSNWWKGFFEDAWFRFDFAVVVLSLVQVVLDAAIFTHCC